jgi:hypothetical protein
VPPELYLTIGAARPQEIRGTKRDLIAYRARFSFSSNTGQTRGWQIQNLAAFQDLGALR